MCKVNIVKKVSIIGIIFNTFLLIIKLSVGYLSKSQSMLADALHSIEDAISSILSYIGARVSAIPNDFTHPYGHGKAEYIFSFIISMTMIIASFTMFKSSLYNIFVPQKIEFSFWLIIVCIINIIIKFILFLYTRKMYKLTKDILIKASMEDHRNDMFLTMSTLIGVTCGYFSIYIIDSVIGLAISLFILYIGLKLFVASYLVLIDTNLGCKQIDDIKMGFKDVSIFLELSEVIATPVGSKYLIILKVDIKEDNTLKKLDYEIKNIKTILKEKYKYIYDVIIEFNS